MTFKTIFKYHTETLVNIHRKMATTDDKSTSSKGNRPSYADRDLRITKENLYMVLALWMEQFSIKQEENDSYKKVGAVLVLPNDMIHAVDCSRNGVHGVARLLMAHPEILQDCKVFVSRKPCSLHAQSFWCSLKSRESSSCRSSQSTKM